MVSIVTYTMRTPQSTNEVHTTGRLNHNTPKDSHGQHCDLYYENTTKYYIMKYTQLEDKTTIHPKIAMVSIVTYTMRTPQSY